MIYPLAGDRQRPPRHFGRADPKKKSRATDRRAANPSKSASDRATKVGTRSFSGARSFSNGTSGGCKVIPAAERFSSPLNETKPTSIRPRLCPLLRKLIGQGFYPFIQQGMLNANGLFPKALRVPRCAGI